MIRVHEGNYVPKYHNGLWKWNSTDDKIEFESFVKGGVRVVDQFIKTDGYFYKSCVNQLEELIFRQEFQRPLTSRDGDVILIQDIKNLVLFLAPSKVLTKTFIRFIHEPTVDRLLKALIIYFEYFLKVVEFILIRRDETEGSMAQLQSDESSQIKRLFAARLSQYRLMVAREYSIIVMGDEEMRRYHHICPRTQTSETSRDRLFHEDFLAFAKQVTWIALHRRAYEVIDFEFSRLFRTEHFLSAKTESLTFTRVETDLLYGKSYKRLNFREQNSPLVQELANIDVINLPVIWIGKRKYKGTDPTIMELELEFIVPESQLCLIDVTHGILGHPKKLYNTMLQINWEAVRVEKYSETYDPYKIVRQPDLAVPELDEQKIRKRAVKYDSVFEILAYYEKLKPAIHKKWCDRDKIVNYFKAGGLLDDACSKAEKEMRSQSYGAPYEEVLAKYVRMKNEQRKKI